MTGNIKIANSSRAFKDLLTSIKLIAEGAIKRKNCLTGACAIARKLEQLGIPHAKVMYHPVEKSRENRR